MQIEAPRPGALLIHRTGPVQGPVRVLRLWEKGQIVICAFNLKRGGWVPGEFLAINHKRL